MKQMCLIFLATAAFFVGINAGATRMHPEFIAKTPKLNRVAELSSEFWIDNAQDFVQKQLNKRVNTNKAKNVILFLGDGMSIPTLAATRVYIGGEEKYLSFEEFPNIGLSKTYCVDYQVPDSACTSTAYLSGVKANYGTIGVNARVPAHHCTAGLDNSTHTVSIAKWAMDAGKVAGLVTTTRVTHASPAGVYAHSANRDWENNEEVKDDKCDDTLVDDIAEQLVYGVEGQNLRVVLGGGRRNFLDKKIVDEEGKKGKRSDKKNLIEEWISIHEKLGVAEYVWNKTDLVNIDASKTDYLLGLFEASHCQYHLDIEADKSADKEPTLSEMVDKAIDILGKHEEGFFLFVEGGRIDHAHHDTQARYALDETAEFSKAIALAKNRLSEDETLILVTSDHAHTMSYAGYNERGADIFGFAGVSDIDKKSYMTLSYANGLGYKKHFKDGKRVDPTKLKTEKNNFEFPATVPLESETHGGDDVAIFALGPWAHLFNGVLEENAIPHILAYASCIGNGRKACDDHSY